MRHEYTVCLSVKPEFAEARGAGWRRRHLTEGHVASTSFCRDTAAPRVQAYRLREPSRRTNRAREPAQTAGESRDALDGVAGRPLECRP